MTRNYQDRRRRETPFSQWLRLHPELDSKYGYDGEDIDGTQRFIWHQYLLGYLRLLEIKTHDAEPTYAQRDTQSIIDQALRFAFNHPDFILKRANSRRPIRIKYDGYPLIQFERTSPDDGAIRIDGRTVSNEEFLRFLKFETRQRSDTREQLRSLVEEIGRVLDNQAMWDARECCEEDESYDGE